MHIKLYTSWRNFSFLRIETFLTFLASVFLSSPALFVLSSLKEILQVPHRNLKKICLQITGSWMISKWSLLHDRYSPPLCPSFCLPHSATKTKSLIILPTGLAWFPFSDLWTNFLIIISSHPFPYLLQPWLLVTVILLVSRKPSQLFSLLFYLILRHILINIYPLLPPDLCPAKQTHTDQHELSPHVAAQCLTD